MKILTGIHFVCSKDANRCEYFEWADEIILPKPNCYHNETCRSWIVKKEGSNIGKKFFCCPRKREAGKCKFFQWAIDKENTPHPPPPTQKDPKKRRMTKKSKKNLRKQRNVLHFCSTQEISNL